MRCPTSAAAFTVASSVSGPRTISSSFICCTRTDKAHAHALQRTIGDGRDSADAQGGGIGGRYRPRGLQILSSSATIFNFRFQFVGLGLNHQISLPRRLFHRLREFQPIHGFELGLRTGHL
jgi:hypothetical protein